VNGEGCPADDPKRDEDACPNGDGAVVAVADGGTVGASETAIELGVVSTDIVVSCGSFIAANIP
jgi:hypothetical protein